MISQKTLETAVSRGVITSTQMDMLRAIEAGVEAIDGRVPVDPERLRFVSGFADIFVTLGIGLFLGALYMLWGETIGGNVALVAASWGLAEWFARRRRMALPSLALTVAFALSTLLLAFNALEQIFDDRDALLKLTQLSLFLSYAALASAVALGLHYWRFRVPVTPALILGAMSAAGLGHLENRISDPEFDLAIFLAGLVAFAAAMWFDARDPTRATNRGEIAFWLHLLAAPLIVHPVMKGVGGDMLDPLSAAFVLLVFLLLGVVALLINRRAMLVSGLFYAGGAIAVLTEGRGFDGVLFPIALLVLGAFILLLSIGWEPLRRTFITRLPHGITRHLPPLTVPAS